MIYHAIQHSLDDECLIRSYDSKQKNHRTVLLLTTGTVITPITRSNRRINHR